MNKILSNRVGVDKFWEILCKLVVLASELYPFVLQVLQQKYDILSFMPTSPSGTEGVHLPVSAFRGGAIPDQCSALTITSEQSHV